jgi:multiple sugar transport system substrate-binding protein
MTFVTSGHCQWATGKPIMAEVLRSGSGTQARPGVHTAPRVVQATRFGEEWLDTVMQSQNVAAPGQPEIVPVTERRDTIGSARANALAGADPAREPGPAAAFKPVRDRSNAS